MMAMFEEDWVVHTVRRLAGLVNECCGGRDSADPYWPGERSV